MDRERLDATAYKYLRVKIDNVESKMCYSNMRGLLAFIGRNNCNMNNSNVISNAYKIIREKVNKKLRYSWKNKRKKTSKAEVKSLLYPQYTLSGKIVMKIPYKSYQLMEAIIDCIEDLQKRKIELHPDLQVFYGQLYGDVFMRKQIQKCKSLYSLNKSKWLQEEHPGYYLYHDFMDNDAPFQKVIRRGEKLD